MMLQNVNAVDIEDEMLPETASHLLKETNDFRHPGWSPETSARHGKEAETTL